MDLGFLINLSIPFIIPLTIVALGGMFSERSGVVNIALEGIMIFGASFGVFLIYFTNQAIPPQWTLLIAIFISGISGAILSLAHAFSSINLKANQTISGTAINLFALAFHDFLARSITIHHIEGIPLTGSIYRIAEIPYLVNIPIIGPILFKNFYMTTLVGVLVLIISSVVLYKTKFGLRLRACGENPQAADSVGINVSKMRYAGIIISGVLAGIGGLALIIPSTVEYTGEVNGYGFLALAVLIFGQWKPSRIFLAACFFGFMQVIANSNSMNFFIALGIPKYFYQITPYLMTLIVLGFTSKKSASPRAAGEPYDQGKR